MGLLLFFHHGREIIKLMRCNISGVDVSGEAKSLAFQAGKSSVV